MGEVTPLLSNSRPRSLLSQASLGECRTSLDHDAIDQAEAGPLLPPGHQEGHAGITMAERHTGSQPIIRFQLPVMYTLYMHITAHPAGPVAQVGLFAFESPVHRGVDSADIDAILPEELRPVSE